MALTDVECPNCGVADQIDPGDEPLEPWQEVRWECSQCRQVIVEVQSEIPQAEYAIAQAKAIQAVHLAALARAEGLPESDTVTISNEDVVHITASDFGVAVAAQG